MNLRVSASLGDTRLTPANAPLEPVIEPAGGGAAGAVVKLWSDPWPSPALFVPTSRK